ncbi:Hypothetical protein GSB_152596, partial [Giardia duodenalis]
VAWGDDEGQQRLSIGTPARIVHSPPGTASRAIHASEYRPLLPTRRSCRDRCTSRGPINQGRGGAQQLPRARRPVCLALSGCKSHRLADALGHSCPDRGDWGAHGWGTVVAGLFWGSAVLGDSAWWTVLLALAASLHRCSAGHFLLGAGATVSVWVLGAACAGRRGAGRA